MYTNNKIILKNKYRKCVIIFFKININIVENIRLDYNDKIEK